VRGQSGYFDGSSGIVVPSGLVGTDSFSVSAWAKTPNGAGSGQEYIVDLRGDVDLIIGQSDQASSNATITIWDGSYSDPDIPIDDDAYRHFVGTYDGSTLKLYVNGSLVLSESSSPNSSSEGSRIGQNDGGGGGWDGNIDDVRIYDRALSPSEIHELYRYGSKGRDLREKLVNA